MREILLYIIIFIQVLTLFVIFDFDNRLSTIEDVLLYEYEITK